MGFRTGQRPHNPAAPVFIQPCASSPGPAPPGASGSAYLVCMWCVRDLCRRWGRQALWPLESYIFIVKLWFNAEILDCEVFLQVYVLCMYFLNPKKRHRSLQHQRNVSTSCGGFWQNFIVVFFFKLKFIYSVSFRRTAKQFSYT